MALRKDVRPKDAYFHYHIFCCTHERPEQHPKGCCAQKGSKNLLSYLRLRVRKLGLKNVRVNAADCLTRCELGPSMVVYPDGVWYRCATEEAIDEVLEKHIKSGEQVDHLLLDMDS